MTEEPVVPELSRAPAASGTGTAEVVELQSQAEFAAGFAIMCELRPELTEDLYWERLSLARPRGYRMFGLKVGGCIRALLGVERMQTVHDGTDLCIQEIVTTAEARSQGYGRLLATFAEDLARREGCRAVYALSNVVREEAHRFYEREGFRKVAHEFRKDLA